MFSIRNDRLWFRGRAACACVVLLTWAPAIQAACASTDAIATMVRDWRALMPLLGVAHELTLEDGLCTQQLFLTELAKTQGRVVGYKAGLTNRALQQRFGYPQPLRGTLFEKMLLLDGAHVAARFGARPVVEADLLVEVGDDALQQATTPIEVLRSLSRVTAFIELPDLVLADGEPVTGAAIAAINVGARLGVVGGSIPVEATPAFVAALARMQIVVTDHDGAELTRGQGTAILDHPLNAVIWLAQDLARAGIKLKRGDLLSLGAFAPPLVPRAGTTITVSYEGLPGAISASVTFN